MFDWDLGLGHELGIGDRVIGRKPAIVGVCCIPFDDLIAEIGEFQLQLR